MRTHGRPILGSIAGVAIVLAAWLGYIGYFGGQLYFDLPARNVGSGEREAGKPLANAQSHTPKTVAVIFSGDMGFRMGQGPQIARRIAEDGLPVQGVSSLVYFRSLRSEAEVRSFIVASIRRALDRTMADRVVLIGQSFGADILQAGTTELPADLRAKVQTVILIVPGDKVTFRASPAELFDWMPVETPALPSARRLTWAPVLCVYGEKEANSLCPLLHLPNSKTVALPGGHLLNRDADAVYQLIREQIRETRDDPLPYPFEAVSWRSPVGAPRPQMADAGGQADWPIAGLGALPERM